jgi:hypothetical protein
MPAINDILEVTFGVANGTCQHLQHECCLDVGNRNFELNRVAVGESGCDGDFDRR